MNAAIAPRPGAAPGPTPAPVLRTLVVCDLVESTALVERIGDARALALFRRHDRAARDLIESHRGHEIDKTDGFLLLFERPLDALAFALAYQRLLRELGDDESTALKARVGVHVGEVVVYENTAGDVSRGAKRVEVEGLVKPVAARLMGLALPGQVLVSGMLFGLAQRSEPELLAAFPGFVWKFHGRYAFKGVPLAMPVYEIGEKSIAPLIRPVASDKAWRARPAWLRPRVLLAELALVLLAGAIVLFVMTRTRPAIAFAERDWVVLADVRNLTRDTVFDESLEAAFRISLEQSRFVNVVSDLEVRGALGRMKRDASVPIDLAAGSEIAMREGARALIVPTVAEVGGRLRVSAELVDPSTHTTVFAEAADGVGTASVLDSIDTVTARMRERLGEALAQIEEDSAPLPKVTTANLDALRAYALGNEAYFAGDYAHALELFEQALTLDPEFALAHAAIGRVMLTGEDIAGARVRLAEALRLGERLTARERLYVDALAARFEPPPSELGKWRAFGEVYPDAHAAHANFAIVAADQLNRYEDAIAAARKATSPHYPRRATSLYQLGIYHLALDRIDEALGYFEQAVGAGQSGALESYANAHAVRRDHARAAGILGRSTPSNYAPADVGARIATITLPLDQGRWDEALAAMAETRDAAERVGGSHGPTFRVQELSLRSFDAGGAFASDLATTIDALAAMPAPTDPALAAHYTHLSLTCAYLAARTGALELAERTHAALRERATASGYPSVERLGWIVEAELLRARGEPGRAIERLEKQVDGFEPYLARIALARALADAGQHARAAREFEWLAAHRGRAYAEYASMRVLRPYYVAESNLALLDAAGAWRAAGNDDEVADALRRFRDAWPGADERVGFVAARIAAARGSP